MIEVERFLKHHEACSEGFTWATENCATMQEVWDKAKPEWLLWLATRDSVCDDMDLHRFSVWCVRQVWHLLTDERSRNAVETKERWIDGEATDEELASAWAAARASALVAARASARDSAWVAAWAAARASAWAAARDSAWASARDSAWAAARDSAWAAQAKYIREHIKPNFDL